MTHSKRTRPTLGASASGMYSPGSNVAANVLCQECDKALLGKDDYIFIGRGQNNLKLYYHIECFEQVAGEEFMPTKLNSPIEDLKKQEEIRKMQAELEKMKILMQQQQRSSLLSQSQAMNELKEIAKITGYPIRTSSQARQTGKSYAMDELRKAELKSK